MKSDHNFDSKAEWFQRRIYGGPKGQLRLEALWGDLLKQIPDLENNGALSVWDAGGGLGQMSLRLAALGHNVLLNDISAEMLALAGQSIEKSGLQTIELRHSSIQSQAAEEQKFDLIVCHAVLEWLSDPRAALECLLGCLKPGGRLSLAIYNINSVIMMNVLKGNFNKALSGEHSGHVGSLTPPSPQDPAEVLVWLEAAGMQVKFRAGVRVAYDYLGRELKEQRSSDDLLKVENFLREQEAFWRLGRYVHFIAVKPC